MYIMIIIRCNNKQQQPNKAQHPNHQACIASLCWHGILRRHAVLRGLKTTTNQQQQQQQQ